MSVATCKRPAMLLAAALLSATLVGCATGFDFQSVDSVPFRERAVTQVEDGVRVTAAVPDKKETRELFGLSLYRKRIQPVWIEIENDTDQAIGFMPMSVDADYHTPLEIASLTRGDKKRQEAEQQLFRNSVNMWIGPGQTRSGFIFTNADEGTKAFNVDLLGDDRSWAFTFFIPVPGLAVDHYDVDFRAIYAEDEVTNFTEPEPFIAALEDLPCCVVDSKGETIYSNRAFRALWSIAEGEPEASNGPLSHVVAQMSDPQSLLAELDALRADVDRHEEGIDAIGGGFQRLINQ